MSEEPKGRKYHVGPRALHKLGTKVPSKPGRHSDGGGLYLRVDRKGSRRWVFRGALRGELIEGGLGPFPAVSLKRAREMAAEARAELAAGRDFRLTRHRAVMKTFEGAFHAYFYDKEPQLRNKKHAAQWESTMRAYVFPEIGREPVAEVTPDQVLRVLRPIWRAKPETARRVLQRMSRVFESAIVRGFRAKANPCVGMLDELGRKRPAVVPHASLPWKQIPAFMSKLLALPPTPVRLCLEFQALTAARPGEARLAVWREIDRAKRVWHIPAERMKSGKAHRVPLSAEAMACLNRAARLSLGGRCEPWRYVFPGARWVRPISDASCAKVIDSLGYQFDPHGLRKSFRTWGADTRAGDRDVLETCLAHAIGSDVERTYQESDLFDLRRPVMDAWGRFCCPPELQKDSKEN